MSNIDIYRLIHSLDWEEEELAITGCNFFDFCLELEDRGIIYEFSENSLYRFESQFKDNVRIESHQLKIHFSDDFRRTIKLLNQNNDYLLTEVEIKNIWKKTLK